MVTKQTRLTEVPVGVTFSVWNRKYTVLDKSGDRVFVLAAEIDSEMPFRNDENSYSVAPNDFRDSSIKAYLNGEYLQSLRDCGAKEEDIFDMDVDLKCTLGQHEYGKDSVKVGLLSLEEYGEYYDLIPLIEDWWWLITPWKTPSRSPDTSNTNIVWIVLTNGNYSYYYYSYSYGVRPALTLNASLLVSWETEESENEQKPKWSKYIEYLIRWTADHIGEEFAGMSPACYESWCVMEGEEDDE